MKSFDLPFPLSSSAYFQAILADPLALLRVINCMPNADWQILIGYPSNHVRSISILAPANCPISNVIAYLSPWLAMVQQLTVYSESATYQRSLEEMSDEERCISVIRLEEVDGIVGLKINEFAILMASQSPLEANLVNRLQVERYLRRHTWLGSARFRGKLRNLRLQVGPTAFDFLPQAKELDYGRKVQIRRKASTYLIDAVAFSFNATVADRSTNFRTSELGEFDLDDKNLIEQCLSNQKLPHGVFEIEHLYLANAVAGRPALRLFSDTIIGEFVSFINSVTQDDGYLELQRKLALKDLAEAAKRLDERKHFLLSTDFVYFRKHLVYKVPRNENELISLHQKLEGLGAIPMSKFVSLEFTPQLGIDAIASFKVRDGDSIQSFGGVEFEYKLESFFKHGHPEGQTDLIICWRVDGPREKDLAIDPVLPWLFYLDFKTKKLPVACVSKYPKITIERMNIL